MMPLNPLLHRFARNDEGLANSVNCENFLETGKYF